MKRYKKLLTDIFPRNQVNSQLMLCNLVLKRWILSLAEEVWVELSVLELLMYEVTS